MKNIIIFTSLILSLHTFAQDAEPTPIEELSAEPLNPTKLWCIVYFKERPNTKLILEAESVGAIDRKSENYLTLKGKILDSREYSDINLYIVRASACTTDLQFAKKTRDERNQSLANSSPSKDSKSTKKESKTLLSSKKDKIEKEVSKKSSPVEEQKTAVELKHKLSEDPGIQFGIN